MNQMNDYYMLSQRLQDLRKQADEPQLPGPHWDEQLRAAAGSGLIRLGQWIKPKHTNAYPGVGRPGLVG